MSEHEEIQSTGKIGMWLFIATEILLFGGLFLLYSIYRFKNPESFHTGSKELSLFFGSLNTIILITSSFTVALSIFYLKNNRLRLTHIYLLSTIGLAVAFLIVKTFEWSAKFEHGLFPNSTILLLKPKGEILYFGLYYMMTGLHAVHVIVGICILSFVLIRIKQKRIQPDHPLFLVNAGLYWHLVDFIWIYLFPLFYLIG